MIRFDLTCAENHSFDSWYRSGADCDSLLAKGMVACTECGTTDVRKALMAPKVSTSDKTGVTIPTLRDLDSPSPLERLKREIEETSIDVGRNFAREARDMHAGLVPERPIYGQATGQEAKDLLSDGIPVLPLPFIPKKNSN